MPDSPRLPQSPLPRVPFRVAEFRRALALIMPESEAAAFAVDLLTDPTAPSPLTDDAIVFLPFRKRGFTEDTLILLSLVSPDLDERVQRLRARYYVRLDEDRVAAVEDHWNQRRQFLLQGLRDQGKL